MKPNRTIAALAAGAAVALIGASAADAAPTAIEGAEFAGLSPQLQALAQAKAGAVGGNSVSEVLQVMLLNNIKVKREASLIVAMDWNHGIAVVQRPSGGLAAVHFDPRTLLIKG